MRGICHPKRLSKIAGKLVFKAPLWGTFLARQKGASAAGPRPGAASPENKPRGKRNTMRFDRAKQSETNRHGGDRGAGDSGRAGDLPPEARSKCVEAGVQSALLGLSGATESASPARSRPGAASPKNKVLTKRSGGQHGSQGRRAKPHQTSFRSFAKGSSPCAWPAPMGTMHTGPPHRRERCGLGRGASPPRHRRGQRPRPMRCGPGPPPARAALVAVLGCAPRPPRG